MCLQYCLCFQILLGSLINNITIPCKYFAFLYPHTTIRIQLCKYFTLQIHQITRFQNYIHLGFKTLQCFLASVFSNHRIMQTRMTSDVLTSGKAQAIHAMTT